MGPEGGEKNLKKDNFFLSFSSFLFPFYSFFPFSPLFFIFFKAFLLRIYGYLIVFVYYVVLSSSSSTRVTTQCLKLCCREHKDAAKLSNFTAERKEAKR